MSTIINKLKELNRNDDTQDKLAEIYFSSHNTGQEFHPPSYKAEKPVPHSWIKRHAVLISSLMCIALLTGAVLYYLFSTYTVNVTVNRKERHLYPDLLFTQDVNLIGKAVSGKRYFSLAPSTADVPASISIDLNRAVDMRDKLLSLAAMPVKGGGKLKVILRDKNYRSYVSDTLNLKGDVSAWKNVSVPLDNHKLSVDMQRIRHIRLELEADEFSDMRNGRIYVKEVTLTEI